MKKVPKAFLEKRLNHFDRNLAVSLMSEPEPGDPVGNFGMRDVRDYLRYSFIGKQQEASTLLSRSGTRLRSGLEAGEEPGSLEQHSYELLTALGLVKIFEEEELPSQTFLEARRFLENWWRRADHPWTSREIVKFGLSPFMALSILGSDPEDGDQGRGSLQAAIDMYELHRSTKPRISSKTLKPFAFGYLTCQHYLNGSYERQEMLNAGRRVVTSNLLSWMNEGSYEEAALWLLIVHCYPGVQFDEPAARMADVNVIFSKAWADTQAEVAST